MELYDTTLRDGMQSPQLRLSLNDRIRTLKLLDGFGVDLIELGWPGASPADDALFEAASGMDLNAKTAAFGSTRRMGKSATLDTGLTSLLNARTDVCTIFGKTDPDHVRLQLRASPEENLAAISDSVSALLEREVVYDAEHFFDGFKKNSEYALQTLQAAAEAGASTLVLCDTNGGTLPLEARHITEEAVRFLEDEKLRATLGIHAHNDSGCAVANTLVVSDIVGHIQVTLNGVGERTGNADLCQVVPALVLKKGISLNCDAAEITQLSRRFDEICGLSPSPSRPYVGSSAFSHKGGVHLDAVSKGASYEHVPPSSVGNSRRLSISDLSGRSAVMMMLEEFGISVPKSNERVRRMMDEIEEMSSRGYRLAELPAEKRLLAEKHFLGGRTFFSVKRWKVVTERRGGEFSECVIEGVVDGKQRSAVASLQDKGPVAALYRALREMLFSKYSSVRSVKLSDYEVGIADPRGESSTVRVVVEFENGETWKTEGVSPNIIEASLEAIEKGFRFFFLKKKESGEPL